MLRRRLIRQAREDGFLPVLYVLPITDIHRGFYEPGDYEAFLRHVAALARSEGVRWVDFDTSGEFGRGDFHDTNHLRARTTVRMAELFADRVVLPSLAELREQARGPDFR